MEGAIRTVDEGWTASGGRIVFAAEVGRWRGAIAAIPLPMERRPEIRFLAADVDGYAWHGLARYSPGSPDDKRSAMQAECMRLLRGLDGDAAGQRDLWILENGKLPAAATSRTIRVLEPGFFEGAVVPEEDGLPAVVDAVIAGRLRPCGSGPLREADVLEASGVWHDMFGRLAKREVPLPGRFTSHAFPWTLPASRRAVARVHADRPWIARALDTGPRSMAAFVAALPGGGEGPTPGAAAVAGAYNLTQRMGHPGGEWRVSAAAVRSWDASRPDDGVVPKGLVKSVLVLASALPPSWMPRTRTDWTRLSILSRLVACEFVQGEAGMGRLFAHSRGDWPALFEALRVDPDDLGSIGVLVGGIQDMVLHVSMRVVRPVLRHLGTPGCTVRVRTAVVMRMFEGDGIVRLARCSERWHEVQARLPVPSVLGDRALEWKPLDGPFRTPSGAVVRFLVDGSELAAEGEAMSHCVASYTDACASGSIHVASVADDGGERLSTVEIGVVQGVPTVLQHHGFRNGPPPPQAVEAVAAWIAHAEAAGVCRASREYDPSWAVGGAPERRFAVPETGMPADWRGILHRRLARMTWEELVDEIGRIASEEAAAAAEVGA